MNRYLASMVALTAALALTSCSPTAEPTASPTAEITPTTTPTPTETPAANDTFAFGDTATLEFDGSVWAITIQQPVDADPSVTESFPLDDPSTRYVSVPGTITRVEGAPAEPITEVEIGAVVDNRTITAEYLGTSEGLPPLPAVGEIFPGGEAPFAENYIVPSGSEVLTVSVIVGIGEAAQRVFFGQPVDTAGAGPGETSSSPDVESMKYLWNESAPDTQAQTLANVGLAPGAAVTDEAVALTVERSNEIGIILDEAEAREFLEWAVQQ